MIVQTYHSGGHGHAADRIATHRRGAPVGLKWFSRKGSCTTAREVNRAHILAALDREVPESQIMEVLGVGRTAIWRNSGRVSAKADWNMRYMMRRDRANPRQYGYRRRGANYGLGLFHSAGRR